MNSSEDQAFVPSDSLVQVSASGAATATYSRSNRIKVVLNSRHMKSTDEQKLAEEIEQCILDVMAEITMKFSQRTERYESSDVEVPAGNAQLLREKLQPELTDIEVTGKSPGELVEVGIFGDGDIVVQIHNNAVRRTDISTHHLEQEVNDAIDRAMHEYAVVASSTRKRLYDELINCNSVPQQTRNAR